MYQKMRRVKNVAQSRRLGSGATRQVIGMYIRLMVGWKGCLYQLTGAYIILP